VLLGDYNRILESNFCYRNKNEGVLKVTGGHVRYTSANLS